MKDNKKGIVEGLKKPHPGKVSRNWCILFFQQKTEKEILLSLPYVERAKAEKGIKWASSDLIKVVLGPRRAGKSVFSLMLLKDREFAYFNFDDPALVGEKLDLYELMDELRSVYGDTKYVLFDEIQNLSGWELFALVSGLNLPKAHLRVFFPF